MQNFKPKDVVAIILIIGLIVFKLTGHNGSLDLAVAVVVGYYFAHRKTGDDNGY